MHDLKQAVPPGLQEQERCMRAPRPLKRTLQLPHRSRVLPTSQQPEASPMLGFFV